jgi:DNA-binding MarR family transcriptional regulator
MSTFTKVPFETTGLVRDRCLCLHVQRAARRLARIFDDALRPHDLTNGQFSLLMGLNRPKPVSIAPLASLLAMDRTTLTAALKPLERRSLITVTADPADRRSRLLALTQSGHDLLLQALPAWQKAHNKLDALVPSPDRLRDDLQLISKY